MPLTIRGHPVVSPDTPEARGKEARLALITAAITESKRLGQEIDATLDRLDELCAKLRDPALLNHPKRPEGEARRDRLLAHLSDLKFQSADCTAKGAKVWDAMETEEKRLLAGDDWDLPLWAVWTGLKERERTP